MWFPSLLLLSDFCYYKVLQAEFKNKIQCVKTFIYVKKTTNLLNWQKIMGVLSVFTIIFYLYQILCLGLYRSEISSRLKRHIIFIFGFGFMPLHWKQSVYNRNNAVNSTIHKRVSSLPLHLHITSLPIILPCCVLQEIILAIAMIQEYQLVGLD